MAQVSFTEINGCTKLLYENGRLEYKFANGQVVAVENNQLDWGIYGQRWIKFADIADKGGATTMEDYVDNLCRSGIVDPPIIITANQTLGTSNMQTASEVDTEARLSEIDKKLENIIFLLKAIAK